MAIAKGMDTNSTMSNASIDETSILQGLYYYYLDNSIIKSNNNSTVPLLLNSIQTLSYLPFFNVNNFGVVESDLDYSYFKVDTKLSNIKVYRLDTQSLTKNLGSINLQNKIDYNISNNIPLILLCYPYRYFLLSDGINPPLTIKLQNLKDNKIDVVVESYITQNGKYKLYVNNDKTDYKGQFNAIVNNVSLLLPIGTNVYNSFLATNGNSFNNGVNMSLMENNKSFKQGMENLNLSNKQNEINTIMGGISSILKLSLGGVIDNTKNAYFNKMNNDLSTKQLRENRQFNEFAIESQKVAKINDFINTPRTMKTLGNDVLFNINNTKGKVMLYEIGIKTNQYRKLENYFTRYGYKIEKYKIPQFKSKQKFNFIKTVSCNVDNSKIPYEHTQEIESIFNNGITFWHVENNVEVGEYGQVNRDV